MQFHIFILSEANTALAALHRENIAWQPGAMCFFTIRGCQTDFRVRAPVVSTGSSVSGV